MAFSRALSWPAVLVVLAAGPARAQQTRDRQTADGEGTVALVAVSVTDTLADARDRIIAEAARGLQAAGVPLQSTDDTVAAPGSNTEGCRDVACMRGLGETLGARYLVRADIDSNTERFTIRVRFVRARDGAHLADESLTCATTDPCSPVPESTAEVAREAGRKAMREVALDAPPVPTAPATPTEPPAGTVGGSADSSDGDFLRGPIPWIAGGVASAAMLGAGIYLLSIDGEATDCDPQGTCFQLRDTAGAGVAWTVAGGVLGAATVAGYFLWGPGAGDGGDDVAIVVTPGGVTVGGRF